MNMVNIHHPNHALCFGGKNPVLEDRISSVTNVNSKNRRRNDTRRILVRDGDFPGATPTH